MTNALLRADEMAERINKSEQWVKREAKAGRLPHRRIGRDFAFTETDLAEYLETVRVGSATTAPADGFAPRSRRAS